MKEKIKDMRKTFFLTLILFCTFECMAQSSQKDKGKLTPTPDPNAPFKVYIPKDLEDCFVELEKMLNPNLISEMKQKSEDDMIEYHHSLGMWIRNNWGLWAGSRLSQYFNQLGIRH